MKEQQMSDVGELRESVRRLTRDLVLASASMGEQEARFLVDAYYQMQEQRKRSDNQTRQMGEEPHAVLAWLAEQSDVLEHQLKRTLDAYSSGKTVGRWMKANYGIGPVIAAGMLAHIDIKQAPTVGHIWRFAGLYPTSKWEKGKKRPWNAGLKVLCWKVGQSFMKFAGAEECTYGKIYRARKEQEIRKNEAGENSETARLTLETKN